MKVKIKDIHADGLEKHATLTADEIGLPADYIACLTPIDVSVHFERVDNTVMAKVKTKGSYALTCARCLEPFEREKEVCFHLDYEVTGTTEFIEYGDDIRQEMIVAHTPIVLCQEDCKGLCSNCGVNLNKEKCKCKQ